jgi:triacylglycerol lipase
MLLVAWLSAALAALDSAAAGVRPPAATSTRPVVLVHGIHSSSGDMARLARHLQREGREVHCLDLEPADGRSGVDELAGQLDAFVDARLPAGKFDLVGFSMGGLVSRYYLQRLGGVDRVDHFVSLAAPHQGTLVAVLNARPGGIQMRRGSTFLRDLERDQESLRQVKFTSFYTPLDLVILPARNSELPQARNVRIWSAWHPGLILEKRCLRAISAALGE